MLLRHKIKYLRHQKRMNRPSLEPNEMVSNHNIEIRLDSAYLLTYYLLQEEAHGFELGPKPAASLLS